MKNNKMLIGGTLCVLAIFLSQIILRAAEVTKYSVQISVTILFTGGIMFAVGMICNKDKLFGFKLNLISAILMMIMCILGSVDYILSEKFPHMAKTHLLLSIMLDLSVFVSVFAFAIFLVVAASITKKNER